MGNGRRSRVEMPAPAGLTARRLAGLGGDVVLFSWEVARDREDDAPAQLSVSERQVLAHVVSGATNRDVARARGVSERTIANQVASILRKLGAASRFELIHRYGAVKE